MLKTVFAILAFSFEPLCLCGPIKKNISNNEDNHSGTALFCSLTDLHCNLNVLHLDVSFATSDSVDQQTLTMGKCYSKSSDQHSNIDLYVVEIPKNVTAVNFQIVSNESLNSWIKTGWVAFESEKLFEWSFNSSYKINYDETKWNNVSYTLEEFNDLVFSNIDPSNDSSYFGYNSYKNINSIFYKNMDWNNSLNTPQTLIVDKELNVSFADKWLQYQNNFNKNNSDNHDKLIYLSLLFILISTALILIYFSNKERKSKNNERTNEN